jgi:hypothetical protein
MSGWAATGHIYLPPAGFDSIGLLQCICPPWDSYCRALWHGCGRSQAKAHAGMLLALVSRSAAARETAVCLFVCLRATGRRGTR